MQKANEQALVGLHSGAALSALNAALGQPALITMGPSAAETAIAQLEERRNTVFAESEALVAAADEEGNDLSDADLQKIEENKAEIEKLDRQITARKNLSTPAQGGGRRSTPEVTDQQTRLGDRPNRVPATPRITDQRGGFRSFGEFAMCVRQARDGTPDNRLSMAATTYGNEGTGADGGYLVPPQFSQEIWQKVQAEENLLNRCASLTTGTNSMTIPKDETTPWQSSGGIQVYWEGEASTIPASKPAFEMSTIRLVKLTALVPISDELLEDAIALESWLRAKAPAKMAAKINTGIVGGTGVGQPLGLLKAPSLISIAKEAAQPADTIYFANINKMWARMYAPWRRNAIWLINQDIEPQLDAMAFDPAATSKVPVYLPPGGVSGSPYASLKGRPVVPIEACSTLGDQGDIILADFLQYWGLTKSAGIKTDTSMHLYFDQALTTFRFIFRVNGQPAWSSVIQPQNGTTTRSWAVTLDERA